MRCGRVFTAQTTTVILPGNVACMCLQNLLKQLLTVDLPAMMVLPDNNDHCCAWPVCACSIDT
jgi:hypothetical protein